MQIMTAGSPSKPSEESCPSSPPPRASGAIFSRPTATCMSAGLRLSNRCGQEPHDAAPRLRAPSCPAPDNGRAAAARGIFDMANHDRRAAHLALQSRNRCEMTNRRHEIFFEGLQHARAIFQNSAAPPLVLEGSPCRAGRGEELRAATVKGAGVLRSNGKPLPQDYSLRSSRLVIEYVKRSQLYTT